MNFKERFLTNVLWATLGLGVLIVGIAYVVLIPALTLFLCVEYSALWLLVVIPYIAGWCGIIAVFQWIDDNCCDIEELMDDVNEKVFEVLGWEK